jgi:hypothetical protein
MHQKRKKGRRGVLSHSPGLVKTKRFLHQIKRMNYPAASDGEYNPYEI